MDLPDLILHVAKTDRCPLYEGGDRVRLSDYVLTFPVDRATCITLVLDVAETFSEWEADRPLDPAAPAEGFFHCSGCNGRIRVEYGPDPAAAEDDGPEDVGRTDTVAAMLKDFSIFESLESHHINQIVPFLKIRRYDKGETILTRGDPGRHLFIILSGKVEVLSDEDLHMAYLEKGEVFGEMSLLSGDPVGATVAAAEPSRILYLDSKDFRKVLNRYPTLQIYFARMLARRLARANRERADVFASGMAGQLSEMGPAELFQALNVNQKSGVVKLTLPDGNAEAIFREGELVGARFDGKGDKAAFYEILMQREGRFVFSHDLPGEYQEAPELGNFMWLLMEGARMQDESTSDDGG